MKVKNLICKINPRSFISDYLIALGVPENEVENYICPVNIQYQSPWDYPNMKLACEMVHDIAVNPESKIGILCDADLDGVTSAVAVYNLLQSIRAGYSITVFHHPKKSHGLSIDVFNQIEN